MSLGGGRAGVGRVGQCMGSLSVLGGPTLICLARHPYRAWHISENYNCPTIRPLLGVWLHHRSRPLCSYWSFNITDSDSTQLWQAMPLSLLEALGAAPTSTIRKSGSCGLKLLSHLISGVDIPASHPHRRIVANSAKISLDPVRDNLLRSSWLLRPSIVTFPGPRRYSFGRKTHGKRQNT